VSQRLQYVFVKVAAEFSNESERRLWRTNEGAQRPRQLRPHQGVQQKPEPEKVLPRGHGLRTVITMKKSVTGANPTSTTPIIAVPDNSKAAICSTDLFDPKNEPR
jgi:hypothetical protein